MAAFSAGPWIIFLVVGVSYADSECRDKSEDISYGSYTLQNEQVIWWCKNNSQAFPEGNRFHISTCPNRRHIQDTQLCETRSNAMEECGNSTNPANAVQVLKSDLPPYVKYFVCEEGMEWDSGSPGQVTQCLDGRWTEIADSCVEESTIPRDCSMIAKMKKGNWAKSGIREITPSGRREDDAIPVYCGLSKRNHAINGWTRFLTYHARNPLPSHNGSGNPDSGDFL
ncbi:uncharacterized protein [Macrobrachium rosenbergii]|uniref:uncharacterized protein n=1 Tax=Macrobrachium rosenbergii TaxID=79674 RepID=UPI0034D5C999